MIKFNVAITSSDKSPLIVNIEIANPQRLGRSEFQCHVRMSTLPSFSPLIGESPLEALENAARFLNTYLQGIAKGGSVEWL